MRQQEKRLSLEAQVDAVASGKDCNPAGELDYSPEIEAKLRRLTIHPTYNGEKADIFSIGATIFMTRLHCLPFQQAQASDPYFKRLTGPMK